MFKIYLKRKINIQSFNKMLKKDHFQLILLTAFKELQFRIQRTDFVYALLCKDRGVHPSELPHR